MIYDEIIVEEEVKNGYYLFTSPDVPGLFVGGTDRQKAWDDIPGVARILLEENNG